MIEWLIVVGIAAASMVFLIVLVDVLDPDPPDPKVCTALDPCPECKERRL